MTNLAAYMAYNPDTSVGTLVLGLYDIEAAGEDDNSASMALGMIDKSFSANYSQGNTSETLTNEARSYLYSKGKAILVSLGIEYIEPSTGVIVTGKSW